MLPTAMRNNHRPATPRGVCLSGHTVRCPSCNAVGALDGWRGTGSVTLCSQCGHGYDIKKKATGVVKMETQSDQQHKRQQAIKDRLKAVRVAEGLSWSDMSELIGIKRLDVLAAPSSKPTDIRIQAIEDALDALEETPVNLRKKEPKQAAAPIIDHKLAEQQRENLNPQLPPAADHDVDAERLRQSARSLKPDPDLDRKLATEVARSVSGNGCEAEKQAADYYSAEQVAARSAACDIDMDDVIHDLDLTFGGEDRDPVEIAHDLIREAIGIEMDDLRAMAPAIDKIIAAKKLGIELTLHMSESVVSL